MLALVRLFAAFCRVKFAMRLSLKFWRKIRSPNDGSLSCFTISGKMPLLNKWINFLVSYDYNSFISTFIHLFHFISYWKIADKNCKKFFREPQPKFLIKFVKFNSIIFIRFTQSNFYSIDSTPFHSLFLDRINIKRSK